MILLVLFVMMRALILSADPPDNLSIESCSEYGDPGNYAFNARSKVVLGDWKIEELGAAPFAPIPHALTYLSFLLFGAGIGPMNLVPLFFSILLWGALYILATKYFPGARLLFFVLLALNYPFGSFSRINDQIMPMTLFVVLAVHFYLKAWDRPGHFFTAALCLALSFLSKGKIIYFHAAVLPLATLFILIQRREIAKIRLNLVRLAYFAGGALLLAVPWFLGIYLRYPAIFKNVGGINAEKMFPRSLGEALSFWVKKPAFSFYPSNRLLAVVLFFYLIVLLIAVFKKNGNSRISPLEIVCSTWLAAGLAIHSFIGYRPIRHYIEFTIPFLILTAVFLKRLLPGMRITAQIRRPGLFFAGLFVLVWAAASSFSPQVFPKAVLENRKGGALLIIIVLALALTALMYLFLIRKMRGTGISISKKWGTALLSVFVVIYAGQNLLDYACSIDDVRYFMKTIGRDLGRAYPQGVFSGLLVPSISLENRNVAHTSWPGYANDDPGFLKRAKVTHLFLGSYNNEQDYYDRNFPDEMKRARLSVFYRMWRSWFMLYDIREGQPPADPNIHEAETMVRDAGIPRVDPEAGGGFAVLVDRGERTVIGRDKFELPGPSFVRGGLVVKVPDPKTSGLRLYLKLTKKGRTVYKKKLDILPSRQAPQGYLRLPFELYLDAGGTFVLEIQAFGPGPFLFDRVELNPGRPD